MKKSKFGATFNAIADDDLDEVAAQEYGHDNVTDGRVTLLAGNRFDGETTVAVIACNDWLRLGPGRTITALLMWYEDMDKQSNPINRTAPTTSANTLRKWSWAYDWAKRAELYDAKRERDMNQAAEDILQSGLALAHNRVKYLQRLAARLWAELEHRIYLNDYKTLGKHDYVKILKMNAPLIREYRQVLDDIAAETGGRRKGVELSGPNGAPIDVNDSSRALLFSRLLSGTAEGSEAGPDPETEQG